MATAQVRRLLGLVSQMTVKVTPWVRTGRHHIIDAYQRSEEASGGLRSTALSSPRQDWEKIGYLKLNDYVQAPRQFKDNFGSSLK